MRNDEHYTLSPQARTTQTSGAAQFVSAGAHVVLAQSLLRLRRPGFLRTLQHFTFTVDHLCVCVKPHGNKIKN